MPCKSEKREANADIGGGGGQVLQYVTF